MDGKCGFKIWTVLKDEEVSIYILICLVFEQVVGRVVLRDILVRSEMGSQKSQQHKCDA